MSAITVRFSDINNHKEAKAEVMSLLKYSIVAGIEHLYFQPSPEVSDLFVIHLTNKVNSEEIEQAIAMLETSSRVKHANRSG